MASIPPTRPPEARRDAPFPQSMPQRAVRSRRTCLVRREWAATETKLEAILRGLLEVPCQATHDEPRIARHKMDIIDAGCLLAQAGFKEERRLFPLGIEKVLNKEKSL